MKKRIESWEEFQIEAKKIFKNWYFKQDAYHDDKGVFWKKYVIWEKPLVTGPGFDTDYKVMVIKEEEFEKYGRAAVLTYMFDKLKLAHEIRMKNEQGRVIDEMMKKNNDVLLKEKHRRMDDTRAMFKENRKLFRQYASEQGGSALSNSEQAKFESDHEILINGIRNTTSGLGAT